MAGEHQVGTGAPEIAVEQQFRIRNADRVAVRISGMTEAVAP